MKFSSFYYAREGEGRAKLEKSMKSELPNLIFVEFIHNADTSDIVSSLHILQHVHDP